MANLRDEDRLTRRIAFLKKVPLFAELPERELQRVANDLQSRSYRRGEIIFHQGDNSNEFYIVMTGKVRIFKISPSGAETSLQIFSTADIIGEFATIDNQPRSATAKAIFSSTLLRMTRDHLMYHMQYTPQLAIAMTRLLVSKSRWTAAYAESIAQYDAAGRLLHTFLIYNDLMGEEIVPGKEYVLDLGLNQTDLASLVGARREWVNRLLKDWYRRGLIRYRSGKITILDLPGVQAERDSRTEANLS